MKKSNLEVKRCRFIAMLRDWSKGEAQRNPDYPQSQIYEYAKKFVNDEITLRNSVDNIINKTETQIKSAANILEICTCYLCLYNLIRIDDDNLITGLSDYINTNLTKDLSVEHLCSAMKISRSRLYEISHKYYKMSIAKYIRKNSYKITENLLTNHI